MSVTACNIRVDVLKPKLNVFWTNKYVTKYAVHLIKFPKTNGVLCNVFLVISTETSVDIKCIECLKISTSRITTTKYIIFNSLISGKLKKRRPHSP